MAPQFHTYYEVHSEVDGHVSGAWDEDEAETIASELEKRYGHGHWVEEDYR